MDLFEVKQAKAPVKKDFRSFLKQKKAVGADIKTNQDVIVVQEKLEEQQMND
jgi:hypothetical protein